MSTKKKVLIISPHLSTGGAPQVTLNKINLIKDEYEIMCVEYAFVAWTFVVQRNQIQNILGDNFRSLGEDKGELINIINDFNPDVISMEEFPEFFMDDSVTKQIYVSNRNYTILETTHDSSFDVKSKRFFPDKFIFVSAFNAFRYSVYDIPYEIVEYPVDFKEKNTKENQTLLDFDPSYKHVLNVGLFTRRKNQSYIFEIAEKLKNYKIKFHFLGNQADNFKEYWEPLLTNKPDNCVIWGERKDVPSLIEASDLFLFPSKGDRYNKELNPIALKEALEYRIPMMMHNLDVYCGKYDDYENITFLTGDIDKDCENLLSILKPYKEFYENELVIVGTYPNTKSREKLTLDCIESVKRLGRKVMVVSHYPVSEEIQRKCDYYVYDKFNPTTEHSYYTKFFNYKHDFDVEININGLKDTNQSLPVLTNLINGFKSAKDLGFTKVFYITYDVILSPDDIPHVNNSFEITEFKNAHLCTLPTPFGRGIETTAMTFKTDYFLDKLQHVTTKDSYSKLCSELRCQNFLEDVFWNVFKSDNTIQIVTNEKDTILINSGKGVSSNSEYYSIVPINNTNNKWAFYFYTYNIDNRSVNVEISEGDYVSFSKTFNIQEHREFLREIEYRGTPIKIKLTFYEENIIYKIENYELNDSTIITYKNNGWFKYKKLPKIKLVHLQTTNNDEREILSRESLKQVIPFGIEYVLHVNEPYKSLPPSHNSVRPQCVSMELFDEDKSKQIGTALTPSHYGCFESFKNAILSEFDNDLDFLIVCEGDCIIEVPIDEFVEKVKQSCNIVNESDIQYFSFGDTKTLDFGWHQSNMIKEIPNQDLLFITDKIIGLQCIMFPRKTKEFLHTQLRTHKWDCADTYFNIIFAEHGLNMGILNERITTQADGVSLIDQEFKTFIKR
jgi:hypothetical protein